MSHTLKILAWNNNEIKVWEPEGKPWKGYTLYCKVECKGKVQEQWTVKTFTPKSLDEVKEAFKVGAILENCETQQEKQTGQNFSVYKFPKKQFSKGGGYNQVQYTQVEYDALFNHACNKASEVISGIGDKVQDYSDIYQRMMSTYLISAVNAGVKIQVKTTEQKQVEAIQQTMQGTVTGTEPMCDEDIPF